MPAIRTERTLGEDLVVALHGGRPITDRQMICLQFIEECVRERGFPPTLREIGTHMGIRSTNGVNDHLMALEKKGYIRRDPTRSRGIRVIAPTSEPIRSLIPPIEHIANAALSAEMGHWRDLLRRTLQALLRAPELTAEQVVLAGDIREALRGHT